MLLGQRFTVAIYACAFTGTCGPSFTVHSVCGILISFRVFSCAFFSVFFLRIVRLSSFVFPGDFVVFFFGRLGGLLLSPYVVVRLRCAGPFIRCFSSFSACPLCNPRSIAC